MMNIEEKTYAIPTLEEQEEVEPLFKRFPTHTKPLFRKGGWWHVGRYAGSLKLSYEHHNSNCSLSLLNVTINMIHSDASGCVLLIDTSLNAAIIMQIIVKVDADIADRLTKAGLADVAASELTRASEYWTAARVLARDWAGGTTPDTHKIGEFSQKSGIQEQIAAFEAKGEKAIQDYIHDQKKGDYPEIFGIIENKTNTNL